MSGEGTISQAEFRKRDPSGIAWAGGSKDKREQGGTETNAPNYQDIPGQAVMWGWRLGGERLEWGSKYPIWSS